MENSACELHLVMVKIVNYEYDIYAYIKGLVRVEFTIWLKDRISAKNYDYTGKLYRLINKIPRLIPFDDERRKIWDRFLIIMYYEINRLFYYYKQNEKYRKECLKYKFNYHIIYCDSLDGNFLNNCLNGMEKTLRKHQFPKHHIINCCNSMFNCKIKNTEIIMDYVKLLKEFNYYEI